MTNLKRTGILWAVVLAIFSFVFFSQLFAKADETLPGTALKKLSVQGQEIVTAEDKKPVLLRGVVFTGGVWFYSKENPGAASIPNIQFMQSEADIQRVSRWGANVITFYLNYNWFESAEGYRFMDQLLRWCRKANVYIVPSLTVYPNSGPRGGTEFFTSPEARDRLEKFWIEFAGRYRDRPEIAGYDILNEPQGASVEDIASYQRKLIRSIRKVDADTIIFIEPLWGNPRELKVIHQPNLVYNAHYYEPYYFTSQGWPWMYAGGVPVGLDYPDTKGVMIKEIKPVNGANGLYLPVVEAGTYNWRSFTVSEKVPAGAGYAYLKLFSNGDNGATLWFDQVEYSLDGVHYQPIPNGSFEVKNPIYNEPLYWEHWQAAKGSVFWTDAVARDGKYSICIQNASGWVHYGNYSETGWCATIPAIQVSPGQKLSIRFWVKAQYATSAKNGLLLFFCRAQKEIYTKNEAERDMNLLLTKFSKRYNVPLFIGEFTPSLLGKRPDIYNYIGDLTGYWNEHNISWVFYHYRDTGEWYMGIYNGPPGVPTQNCNEDKELRKLLQSRMQ